MHRLNISLCCLFLLFVMNVRAASEDGFLQRNAAAMHGFISQGYAHSTDNNFLTTTKDGSFEFSEVGLNYNQELLDNLSAGVQFFFRNFALDRNQQIIVDWALVDWRFRDTLGFRAGRIKLPYGLHNTARDADVARVWVLLPQSVYDDNFRDFILAFWGGEAYGVVPMGVLGQLDYEGFAGAISIDPESNLIHSAFRGILEGTGGSVIKDARTEMDYLIGAALRWYTPLDGLSLAASGAYARAEWMFNFPSLAAPGTNAMVRIPINVRTWVLSAEYVWRMITVSAEVSRQWFPDKSTLSMPPAPTTSIPLNVRRLGFYTSVEAWVLENLAIGGYWSVFYPNTQDKSSDITRYQRDLDLSLRYDWNEYITLKGEAHRITGVGQLNAFDNPDGFQREWYLFLTRVTVSF